MRKGLPLVEIIAVLVVHGILAAAAVPQYLDSRNPRGTRFRKGGSPQPWVPANRPLATP